VSEKPKINDIQLVRMIDRDGLSQSEAARKLGVSRQAVNQRLQELRGRTTKVIVSKKLEQVTDNKLDALQQLQKINDKANALLDEAEQDHHLTLKVMGEIRGQLKLQLEIFQALFDLQAVQEFQEAVLEAIAEVSPDVRKCIIDKLNKRRAVRQAVKFS